MFALILALSAGAVSGPASATIEYNRTIAHVGSQTGSGYVTFTVAPTAGCSWGNIYLNITTDAGKSYFALLMTAYLAGKPISRIDYTKDAAGTCTVDLVEL